MLNPALLAQIQPLVDALTVKDKKLIGLYEYLKTREGEEAKRQEKIWASVDKAVEHVKQMRIACGIAKSNLCNAKLLLAKERRKARPKQASIWHVKLLIERRKKAIRNEAIRKVWRKHTYEEKRRWREAHGVPPNGVLGRD